MHLIKVYFLIFISLAIFAKPLKGLGVDLKSTVEKGSGREELVLKKLFKCVGRSYSIKKVPYGRHLNDFIRSEYDFVTTVPKNFEMKAYQSDNHIEYINGFIINRNGSFKLENRSDFKGKRLITFKGARKLLPELREIIPYLKSYTEHTKQKLHAKMLVQGRVDIVLSDAFIFEAYVKELKKEELIDKGYAFEFVDMFKHSKFTVYFKDKKLRDKFNKCIVSAKKNGILKRTNYEYFINQIYKEM